MREWIVLFKRPAFAEVAISVNNHSDYSIKMKGELKAYMNWQSVCQLNRDKQVLWLETDCVSFIPPPTEPSHMKKMPVSFHKTIKTFHNKNIFTLAY